MKRLFAHFVVMLMVLFLIGACNNNGTKGDNGNNNTAVKTDQTVENLGLTGGSVNWLEKAKSGDVEAMCELSYILSQGIEAKQDLEKAVFWAKEASDRDCPLGSYYLALAYKNGKGVDKNEQTASTLFRRAFDQSNNKADPISLYVQAMIIINGYLNTFMSNAETDAVGKLTKAANLGYAMAQYELGCCYDQGKFVEKDKVMATQWLNLAVEQGNLDAICQMAMMYLDGDGVAKDSSKAVSMVKMAAEKGHINSMTVLGILYHGGLGKALKMDRKKCVDWTLKAAEKGSVDSQRNMGNAYRYGVGGLKRDKAKARQWYEKAAAQGDQESIAILKYL